MASYSDGLEHESNAKRRKLDDNGQGCGVLCDASDLTKFPPTIHGDSEHCEGVNNPDCDSGYEASTMESLPTPSHQSGEFEQLNHADTSQDDNSIDAEDDNASTVSELSGLSDLSGQEWKPMVGSMTWIQKQMQKGINPRNLLVELGVKQQQIPQYIDDLTLWKLIINMLAEPPRRHKLRHVNTIDDVVRLLKGAQKIIVLTGAGVSVSCGIPDFRSRDGIYSRLAIDFPDLPDPQAMFDISYFTQDPRPFFKFARDIYPGKFQPSPCHRFIKLLEKHNKLLRNYTQNIDTLEKVAEIERVIECHGSFATATCTKCGHRVGAEAIRDTVLAQNIPICEICWKKDEASNAAIPIADLKDREAGELRDLVAGGIMKPDIVFFGEGLPDSFHEAWSLDRNDADLLVVIGSSLKVRPVALIPSSIPAHVPQILINREPLPHCHFDVELLGDCDVIINHLCQILGSAWEESIYDSSVLQAASQLLPPKIEDKSPLITCTCNLDQPGEDINYACRLHKPCDLKSIKERHMSVDSARDSGIGDNSNFTDVDPARDLDDVVDHPSLQSSQQNQQFVSAGQQQQQQQQQQTPKKIEYRDRDSFLNNYELELSSNGYSDNASSSFCPIDTADNTEVVVTSNTPQNGADEMDDSDEVVDYWQPKQKRSITERLPENSFYFIQPSRYIFPGAEVYYDPDDKCTSSDSSESDSDDNDTSDTSLLIN